MINIKSIGEELGSEACFAMATGRKTAPHRKNEPVMHAGHLLPVASGSHGHHAWLATDPAPGDGVSDLS